MGSSNMAKHDDRVSCQQFTLKKKKKIIAAAAGFQPGLQGNKNSYSASAMAAAPLVAFVAIWVAALAQCGGAVKADAQAGGQASEVRELRAKVAALQQTVAVKSKDHCAKERGFIREMLTGVNAEQHTDERWNKIGSSMGLKRGSVAKPPPGDIQRLLSPQGPRGIDDEQKPKQANTIENANAVEVGESAKTETDPLTRDAVKLGLQVGKPLVDELLRKILPKADPLAETREAGKKAHEEGAWKPPKCPVGDEGCWCKFPDVCKTADRFPNKKGTCQKKLTGKLCAAQSKSGKCRQAAQDGGTPQKMGRWSSAKGMLQAVLKFGHVLMYFTDQSCGVLGFKPPKGMKVDPLRNPLKKENVATSRRLLNQELDMSQDGYGDAPKINIPKPPQIKIPPPAPLPKVNIPPPNLLPGVGGLDVNAAAKPLVEKVLKDVLKELIPKILKDVEPEVTQYKKLLLPMMVKKITEKIPIGGGSQKWTLWSAIKDMCWISRNDIMRGGITFSDQFDDVELQDLGSEGFRTKSYVSHVPVPDGKPGKAQEFQLILTRKNGWSTSDGKESVCKMRFGLTLGMCDGCCCKDKNGHNRIGYLSNKGTMIDSKGKPGRATPCAKSGRHENCVEDQCETFFVLADFLWQTASKAIMTAQTIIVQGGMGRPDGIHNQMDRCNRCIDADKKVWGNTDCAATNTSTPSQKDTSSSKSAVSTVKNDQVRALLQECKQFQRLSDVTKGGARIDDNLRRSKLKLAALLRNDKG